MAGERDPDRTLKHGCREGRNGRPRCRLVFLPAECAAQPRHIDLDRVAALTLGPYWRDATPAQRRAFTSSFKDLVVNSYAHAVDELDAWNIRHLPPRAGSHPDRVLVRTQIERPRGTPVAVDYRMIRKDNRWLAYDVLVEGVSLLTNYRSSFTGIARERGIDGLIQELRRRNGTWSVD